MTKAARPDPRAFLTSTLSTLSASALLVAGLAAAPARATTPLSLPANPRVSADIGHPGQAKTATTPDRRLSAQPRAGIGHVAAKSKPKPKIMPATKMITVTWGKVAGATKYQVAYALKKSMKGKKRVTTKRTQAKLKKLKNGKKYYVTVTAQIGAKKVTSKKLSATPTPNWPGSIVKSFKLSSHGLNQVTAKWRKPRAAASILVRVAATRDAFRGKKLPATLMMNKSVPVTATSATITLTPALATKAGSTSGNPLFARVYIKNGKHTNTTPSAMTYAQVAPPTAPASSGLTFAAYNIRQLETSAGDKGGTWTDRRTAVLANILYAKPAVLAVEECSLGATKLAAGQARQCADLEALLKPSGYAPVNSTDQALDQQRGGAVVSTRLFYLTSAVTLTTGGFVSQKQLAGAGAAWKSNGKAADNLMVPWAKFQNKATGAAFCAFGLHLQVGNDTDSVATRQAGIVGIESFARTTAAGVPAVILGDFNSDPLNGTQAQGAQQTYLVSKGWASAAATTNRDVRWNSSCPPVGGVYPTKPLTNDIKVGVRIDGIYTLNVQGSFSFAVQAVLNSSGAFQTGYQPASDHLLVKASLPM